MARCGARRWAADTGRAGVTSIEFAILLPVFVLIVFGIIELALMEWTQAALEHATSMAARCAAVNTTTCGTASAVQTYAASQAYGITLPASTFSYSTSPCNHTVSVASPGYGFQFIVPFYGSITVNLTASSCYP